MGSSNGIADAGVADASGLSVGAALGLGDAGANSSIALSSGSTTGAIGIAGASVSGCAALRTPSLVISGVTRLRRGPEFIITIMHKPTAIASTKGAPRGNANRLPPPVPRGRNSGRRTSIGLRFILHVGFRSGVVVRRCGLTAMCNWEWRLRGTLV